MIAHRALCPAAGVDCHGETGRKLVTDQEKERAMKATSLAGLLVGVALVALAGPSLAQDTGKTKPSELANRSRAALEQLYATAPLAKGLPPKAHAVLVFPEITKAGFGVGGQYGEGTLLKNGEAVAYYNTTGASFGMHFGAQRYGYAMFFMDAKALDAIDSAQGFEVGVGPTLVVADEGMAKTTSTNALKDDIYAFVFGQKGLMAGVGLQGNKITKITP
jgi:lipid-binding SYLF domain-containing protein